MLRRTLLAALGASALPLALPRTAAAAETADPWRAGFAAARARDPRLIGYDSAPLAGFDADVVTLEGRIPAGLSGVLLRTGPARHEVGAARYHHWLDGDGMVQRFGIGAAGVTHRGRYVQTPKFTAEAAAGRMLAQAFGTAPAGVAPPRRTDEMNVANINMLRHAGRTMALWEGGSPTEIDPDDLSTRDFVTYSSDSAGLPFSAHPRHDADGSLWNIGLLPGSGRLVLWHLGADGTMLSLDVLAVPREAGMIHDFVLTERHLLIPLPSLAVDPARVFAEGVSIVETYDWRPGQPFRLLVVDKGTRTLVKTIEMPPGFVFHFGNGWEDASGTIRVDACWYTDSSVLLSSMREIMRGTFKAGTAAEARLLTIDVAAGRASFATVAPWSEFPRFDERFATRHSRQAFTVTSGNPWIETGATAGLLRFDRDSGVQDRFAYGPGIMAEEHVFVPRAGGGEGEGWLVGTSLDTGAGRTRLAVFEATRLADGPLALATLPYALPLGLHGTWVAA
jgi:carotenoid cleavage dioxygenase